MTQQTQEFVVRVPREINKRFNVMRFGSAQNVDVSKWKSTYMERENNYKEFKTEMDSENPEFGAGSEFGRKQKEEAKRKKYTSKKKYNADNQPWILKVGGKTQKKYKGLREGGVSENASYYVFFQAPDGAFEAFPVNEWYNFTPIQRYKALTAEEAEEKFEKRDKILNYFSVMINKKRKEDDTGETSAESKGKMKKSFKVSDMDDWQGMDSDNDNDDRSDEDIKPKIKKEKGLKKKKKGNKKKKGSDDSDGDSEPLEESDEGDFDDKEVDYMSDSSESSEESENEKTNRALKGVEDEDALRQLVISDDSEDEDKEETEKNEKEGEKSQNTEKNNDKDSDKKGKLKSDKLIANFDSPPPSSSDSDSDNSDLDESKSALLIQKKFKIKTESDLSATNSRSATPTVNFEPSTSSGNGSNDSNKLKRKALLNDSPNNVKKAKLSNDNSDGITEEAVRRYLMRKPMTCTDLLQKFKNKVPFKGDLVHTIAQILKRLNPEKQTIKNKLYFSLKPS